MTNLTPQPHQPDDVSLDAQIVAEVTISTASAIITHPDDPYQVLVAESSKHPAPVIPGGKIEIDDPMGSADAPALECIMREVQEEVCTLFLNPRYIGKANDPDRDVRIVSPDKISSTLTAPSFDTIDLQGVAGDQLCIRARYGTPDYIYVGTVDPQILQESEELKNLGFIDIRDLKIGDLAAGHDVVVLKYREMLSAGADRLDEESLLDFEATRAILAAR